MTLVDPSYTVSSEVDYSDVDISRITIWGTFKEYVFVPGTVPRTLSLIFILVTAL